MNNIEKIRQAMPEYKCSAMLIINPVNRLFSTGFSSSAGALIVTEKDAYFFTDSRYIEAAKAGVNDASVELIKGNEKITDCVNRIVKSSHIKSVGFEDDTLSYTSHNEWAAKLNIEMIPA